MARLVKKLPDCLLVGNEGTICNSYIFARCIVSNLKLRLEITLRYLNKKLLLVGIVLGYTEVISDYQIVYSLSLNNTTKFQLYRLKMLRLSLKVELIMSLYYVLSIVFNSYVLSTISSIRAL